ncbi:hypothetical protein DVA76_19535, partial [Acinetobacter baumannii]
EYEACIAGLQQAIALGIRELAVFGDSLLIISQVQGKWKTRDPKLVPYQEYLQSLLCQFDRVDFSHLPRTCNRYADALAVLA